MTTPTATALDIEIGEPAAARGGRSRRARWIFLWPYFYGHDDDAAGVDTAVVAGSIGLLAERHAIELLECFQAMTATQRNSLLGIARALAAANAIAEPAAPGADQGKTTRLRKASSRGPVAV